ncbi:hypothetical protein [Promicromonospora sp. NPDC023987]|uniref:hypothetical protein n=1 Tax=Promicromonospora sp. NPDC023987 TaxID=3155360 RepID=UPI0033DC2A3F
MRKQPDYRTNLDRIATWQRAWRDGTDLTARLYSADRTTGPVVPASLPYDTRGTRRALARDARAGRVERVRRGVYLPVQVESGNRSQDAEAALMRTVRGLADASGTQLCFTHTTAAVLHRCWQYRMPQAVHVTYPVKPKIRRGDDGVRRHWATLTPRDRTVVDRIPVTTLERTVFDCARTLEHDCALVLATSAFRLGADPAVVGVIVDENHRVPSIAAARTVLEAIEPGCASPGEVLTYRAARLVRPEGLETQIQVGTRRGTYWVDSGWPALKVGLEFHGAVKYSGGSFGDPSVRHEERGLRAQALMEEGWRILDLGWNEVIDQQRLELAIRETLLRRRQW